MIVDFGKTDSLVVHGLLPVWEKLEHVGEHFRGMIPRYLQEAGFHDIRVAGRKFPLIQTLVAEK